MTTLNDILEKKKKKFTPTTHRSWDHFEKPTNQTKDSKKEQKKNSQNKKESLIQDENTEVEVVEKIHALKPESIIRWKYKDRPENELGDLNLLSEQLKNEGQKSPCVVMPHPNQIGKYLLIAGERRWRAAKIAGIKLMAIIRQMDTMGAVITQHRENEKDPISEYGRGLLYNKLIEQEGLKQNELAKKLHISKQKMSSLLSFKDIPKEIIDSIGYMHNVSAKTAERIKQISSKGKEYINEIINISGKIRDGKIGASALDNYITNKISIKAISRLSIGKVCAEDGRHVFTWRQDNNGNPSIHFPNDIAKLFKKEKTLAIELSGKFLFIMEKCLSALKKSPTGDFEKTQEDSIE